MAAVGSGLLALLMGACGGIEAGVSPASDPAAAQPPARLVRGVLQPRVLLTGELEAAEGQAVTVPLTPMRQVQIRWMAEDGSRVRAGDPVIELDNEQIVQDIEEKRLDVTEKSEAYTQAKATAELSIADARFGLVRAQAELEKAELEAAVPEGLLAAREYQNKQLELSRARVAVEKAREELATAQSTGRADVEVAAVNLARSRRAVDDSERALDELSLEAPGDGIFVIGNHPWEQRPFQPGDNVWQSFALAQIPDLSTMVVRAQLPDVDDGRIEVGMPVRCVLDAYPDDEIAGRVEEIAEVAKQPSGMSLRRFFDVQISLEHDGSDRLRPGMSVKVEVQADAGLEQLLAPRWAIDWDADPVSVRLADGSAVAVAVGGCDGQRCAVAPRDGREGELVAGSAVAPPRVGG